MSKRKGAKRMTAKEYRQSLSPQKASKHKYNASTIERHGFKFQSKLEADFYTALLNKGIAFTHQKRYYLLPTLKYRNDEKATAKRRCTPDFYLPDFRIIIDTKGFKTEAATLRFVMLKHILKAEADKIGVDPPAIFFVRKGGDIQRFLTILTHKNFQISHLNDFRFI